MNFAWRGLFQDSFGGRCEPSGHTIREAYTEKNIRARETSGMRESMQV